MSNSSYPGSPPDPQQPQQPSQAPLDPSFPHQTWTPPQDPQAAPPQGAPQPPQGAYPPAAPPQDAPQTGPYPQQGAYPPQGAYPQGAPPQGNYPPNAPAPGQPPYPQQPYPQQPYPQQPYPNAPQGAYPQAAPKKSGSKMLLLGLGGCFMLFVLMIMAVVGLYYIGKSTEKSSNPMIVATSSGSGSTTSGTSSGAGVATTTFTNSSEGLNTKLAANYADFSFDYPASWQLERQGTAADAVNFVKVKHDEGTFTLENFAVGYFNGSLAQAPELMSQLQTSFASGFPNFTKISEGNSTFNGYASYELSFTSRKDMRTSKAPISPFHLVQSSDSSSSDSSSNAGSVEIYGKVFLIPASGSSKNGVSIVMLGTSKSPDLSSLDDLGVKGELPIVINSFKLGK